MESPDIYTLSPCDWVIYKSIRLDQLKESPNAFGSAFTREASFSADTWAQRVAKNENNVQNHPLIAEIKSESIG